MKLQKYRVELIDGFVLLLLMMICGYITPWWTTAIPAATYGVFRGQNAKAGITVVTAAILAWVLPAFAQDAAVGFRISLRIAGVAHSPARFIAYALTGLIGAMIAYLGWTIGSSAHEIFLQYAPDQSSSADEQEG